jgi:hypothetical protein
MKSRFDVGENWAYDAKSWPERNNPKDLSSTTTAHEKYTLIEKHWRCGCASVVKNEFMRNS